MGYLMTNFPKCPKCQRPIAPEQCEWGGGSTEAGTDFFTLSIDCPCGWELEKEGWGSHEPADWAEEASDAIEEQS